MARFSNLFVLALSFSVVATSLALMPNSHIAAAASGAPVTVVNTPLPVSAEQSGAWNVGITGTPSVQVSNTPTVNLAADTLVKIQNQTANDGNAVPIMVRDSDSPGRHPFQVRVDFPINDGTNEGESGGIRVPAGKRLVVEYVSANITLPSGQKVLEVWVITTQNGSAIQHFFSTAFQGTSNILTGYFTISQQTRLYSDPSAISAGIVVFRNALSGSGFVSFRISGYLIDLI
jgi:hypothetical protein